MTEPAEPSLRDKVCLVTGATAGIGLVTARELARRGASVLGVGRSQERCDAAVREIGELPVSPPVRFLVADLSSQAEIRRLARQVREMTPRLDALINNAGGIYLKRQETVDGLEMTFAVNHLAYFLLTNLMLDMVKAAAPSRIVSVASAAHKGVTLDFGDLKRKAGRYSPWRAYQRSKLANILFTRELARRMDGTGVTANALHPGYVRTQIFRSEGFAGWLMRRAADLFAISPEQGARTTLYLATSSEVDRISGQYFVGRKAVPGSPQSRDEAAARKLWEASAELTGFSP
jgi:NAD(P)-dependent dehydrogenase (short-subunit alcohol dehydrogenase family)